MAAPAEVSEKRSNFRIRQFKEKRLFNIAANLTLNTMASFVILLIARTARIACVWTYRQTDRHTHTHTHIRDNYCNPLCACAPRVNDQCPLPCLSTIMYLAPLILNASRTKLLILFFEALCEIFVYNVAKS